MNAKKELTRQGMSLDGQAIQVGGITPTATRKFRMNFRSVLLSGSIKVPRACLWGCFPFLIFVFCLALPRDIQLRRNSTGIFGEALATEDGLVAIVDNEVITQKDLNNFTNFMRLQLSGQYSEQETEQRIKQMLPGLITRLIEDRLILQAAYKEDTPVDQNQIKSRLKQIRKKYSTEADFQNTLAAQGLSLAELELKIKEQLLIFEIINSKIKSNIVITPQEVTDYYYAHNEYFNQPEKRLVRFLIIEDSQLAQKLEKSIAKYKDLDAIAKEYSLEITNLGWVTLKQLKEEIADIVFDLETSGLSQICNIDKNFYIFEVKEIVPPAKKRSLPEVQQEAQQLLFESKMQEALVEWLNKLKSEAYIEIKDSYKY
ncbi:MAG: peptidyl-prolyl cis-trans isomerase [Candidatus Omnitrophica bacterium]|nr:peptidyl-prolyl cis-trans isomerase [Candidatus Omnitrophota bacterium]